MCGLGLFIGLVLFKDGRDVVRFIWFDKRVGWSEEDMMFCSVIILILW